MNAPLIDAEVRGLAGELLLRFSLPRASPPGLFEDVALSVWPLSAPPVRVRPRGEELGVVLSRLGGGRGPVSLCLEEDRVVVGEETFVPLACEECGARAGLEFATVDGGEPLGAILCAGCARGYKHYLLARNAIGWDLASPDCREFWTFPTCAECGASGPLRMRAGDSPPEVATVRSGDCLLASGAEAGED